MKFRAAETDLYIGYEAVAALTAVLLLDRGNNFIRCFIAALAHELGHIIAMRICGVRIREIRLRLFDVLIESDRPPSFAADCLITLGGAAFNFITAAVLFPFSPMLSMPDIALGVFNLLPVMSLDGGHLLYIALERRFEPRTCCVVLRITTFVFMLPLMTAGIFLLLKSGYNYSLLAISLYLLTVLFVKS